MVTRRFMTDGRTETQLQLQNQLSCQPLFHILVFKYIELKHFDTCEQETPGTQNKRNLQNKVNRMPLYSLLPIAIIAGFWVAPIHPGRLKIEITRVLLHTNKTHDLRLSFLRESIVIKVSAHGLQAYEIEQTNN